MPKERSFNPVAAERKQEKKKEIAKSKKHQQQQLNDRLAKKNPESVQRQVDRLKQLQSDGVLKPRDLETLTRLEKEVRGIRRAREALGDAAPQLSIKKDGGKDARQEQRERRQLLGKRRRDRDEPSIGQARGNQGDGDADVDVDPSVRSIPMPRDTPPPIPSEYFHTYQGPRAPHALPRKPPPPAPAPMQIEYSSAPQLRNLKKEAVKFTPTVVAQQRNRVKGQGRLLEPEEAERLERAGYLASRKATEAAGEEARLCQIKEVVKVKERSLDKVDEEVRRFEEEINQTSPEAVATLLNAATTARRRNVDVVEVADDGIEGQPH